MKYELDDLDLWLLKKCKEAIEYDDEGHPIKDVLDEDDIIDAIRLLVTVIEGKE